MSIRRKRTRRRKKKKLSETLTMDSLVGSYRQDISDISDHRAKNVKYKLPDIIMSSFALFSQKNGSLLEFEQQTFYEQGNLEQLYGIQAVCSDTTMRTVLDEVPTTQFRSPLTRQIEQLEAEGGLSDYHVLGDYQILSFDGVEFFRSCKVGCKRCLKKKHRNGQQSNSHAMLGAVIVHPDKREVFPIDGEFITCQDGQTKNDCELNATKRLKKRLKATWKDKQFLILEDALYGTVPNIEQILDADWSYMIGVKPGDHPSLFKQFEGRKARNQASNYQLQDEKGVYHEFWWMNNVPLNGSTHIRTNFLYYQQTDTKGKKTTFSWVTDIKIRQRKVFKLMRIGRSRWKIENETFNTLKNQGYHFDHNYGHGYKYLCNNFALLMLSAFLIDQIVQAADKLFQQIEKAIKTKKRLWQDMRALFRTRTFFSFKELFSQLAKLHLIQIE